LRIVLAPSAYYPHIGGIEELTRQLALELGSRGHEVSVLTNRWPAGVTRSEVLDGIRVTRLAFPLPAARPLNAARFVAMAPPAAAGLVRHLRRVRPHVVHVIGAGPQAAYLAALTQLLGTRFVFTAQGELGFDAQNVFGRSATLRVSLRRILRCANGVTACSRFVLDELEGFGAIRATPVVVPNGVRPEDFSENGRSPHEPSYVLAVGRLVAQKGCDVLIEALASESLASLELVIAGEGPERATLEQRAKRMGLAERVHLVGAVDRSRLSGLLAGAEVFAFPSRGEPFGIALLEAMAAGVPSVATRAGGVVEFARDEQNALLVPPDAPEALAAAILRIRSDDSLGARLSAAGRETARTFSWGSIVPQYEQVYIESLGGSPTRMGIGRLDTRG
jgi:glycogen synthase